MHKQTEVCADIIFMAVLWKTRDSSVLLSAEDLSFLCLLFLCVVVGHVGDADILDSAALFCHLFEALIRGDWLPHWGGTLQGLGHEREHVWVLQLKIIHCYSCVGAVLEADFPGDTSAKPLLSHYNVVYLQLASGQDLAVSTLNARLFLTLDALC